MQIKELFQRRKNLNTKISRRDDELLLQHILKCQRTFLYAHNDYELTASEYQKFQELARRRELGEPLAYLCGIKAFWDHDFIVTPDVLIPRPETERLIEVITTQLPDTPTTLVDLGTGSGIIALTLAQLRTTWHITATDQSITALQIAKINAKRLNLQDRITFLAGSWFAPLAGKSFDCIVSNPPYIAQNDPHLTQNGLPFEPQSALVSGVTGLDDLTKIILEAPQHLTPQGILCLEHGYDQKEALCNLLCQQNYRNIQCFRDFNQQNRVIIARTPSSPA